VRSRSTKRRPRHPGPASPERAEHRLHNGTRVVAVRAPGLRTGMIAAYVRVGSRYETARTNGVSHFLEHAFFRGSARFPSTFDLNVAIEDVGGSLNASTGRESSAYFTPVHPQHLDRGVEVLADMLSTPRLTDVELEREIILEEMLDEVDVDGHDIDLDNISKQQLFGGHGLSLKIAGTPESVRGLTVRDLRAHLARHYHGGNLVLCAAGDFDPATLFAAAEAHLASFAPARPRLALRPPRVPSGPTQVFTIHDESQAEFRLTFPAAPESHPDYYPLILLGRVLDDGLASRLQRAIVEERALAYSVGAGVDRFSDISLFELEAATTLAKAPRVVAEMGRLLGELCTTAVGEEELLRAKRRHAIALEFALDSTVELCSWYGSGALFGDGDDFAVRRARVEAVTPADVLRVAQATFSPARLHFTYVGPDSRRERRALERWVAAPTGLV
jgi:predicted Zn-dependent peptidase